MYKTHPTLALLLTGSVMTAAACSLDVTLDPEDMRKPAAEAGQTDTNTKKTVSLELGTCSIQNGTTETAKYSADKPMVGLVQILYPNVCVLPAPSSRPVSHDLVGAQVVCTISNHFVLPSPAYVRVTERYWLPGVQNLVTGASSWGSFFSQGSISLGNEMGDSLPLPGVRSSGLVFANEQATKPSLSNETSVTKMTAPKSVEISSVVFHVPSSCQLKGTAAKADLTNAPPEWHITSIEISDSPDFQ